MASHIQKKGRISISSLLNDIKGIISKARYNSLYAINREMLRAYLEIGRKIVEEEQRGKKRAGYGKKLLELISIELTKEFGKGFSADNLERMRKFYLVYKNRISETLLRKLKTQDTVADFPLKLTWSHYCELTKINNETKRLYFEKYAAQEGLSVRDLKRQIYSLHYERLLMSKKKKALIGHETKKLVPQEAEDVIKDPYILEFLDLDEKHEYTEKELETKILNDLQKFLLELGQGFSFIARQRRFTIDNDHFYIDLLFYNIYLRCYVVIELKVGKFKHEDAGQMNFYLNYVKKELNKAGDNDPVGIILCTEKDKVQVEFALAGITNKLFISKYKIYLPSKKELEEEVRRLL